jgi:hypothetical protein
VDYVLLFNAVSMICANSGMSVDDYLGYDMIGAPMEDDEGMGKGVSGGLSLRNVQTMLDIARDSDQRNETRKSDEGKWFWEKLKGMGNVSLPPLEVARGFAVGDVWENRPLGYDGAIVKHKERLEDTMKWCSEYAIALMNRLPDG